MNENGADKYPELVGGIAAISGFTEYDLRYEDKVGAKVLLGSKGFAGLPVCPAADGTKPESPNP